MQSINGETLDQKLKNIVSTSWGYNTDLHKTFSVILTHAKRTNASAEDMPGMILILSDMEFDSATQNSTATAMEDIEQQYNDAGYEVPRIVFWNLNARKGNVPVTFDKKGTALISGFSPSIMKSVLDDSEEFTPHSIMMTTVSDERYDCVNID